MVFVTYVSYPVVDYMAYEINKCKSLTFEPRNVRASVFKTPKLGVDQ